MLTMNSLQWIEVLPGSPRYVDTEHGPMPAGYDLPDNLPDLDKAHRAFVATLVNDVDEHTCGAEGCDQPVGWVLHEPSDDDPGGLPWHMTVLVIQPTANGSVALAVCEECAPDNLYPVPVTSGGS